MLIYLIDGNNLYYAIPKVCDSPVPRRALVDYIRSMRLAGSARNQVVIVFDGHESNEVYDESEYDIIYAKNQSADDVIKGIVCRAKNKRQIVVVSDDRSVIDSARGDGAKVLKTAEFLKQGRKKAAKKEEDMEIPEEERAKITKELEELWAGKCAKNKLNLIKYTL